MSIARGVHDYYSAIKGRLYNYIKSDYLANSETLLLYADDLLGSDNEINTNISREPYIETAASYKKIPDGISKLTCFDDGVKRTLLRLVDADVGIFRTPFKHQVDALEAFASGKDLFVSTGTGSGKTECFLWPIMVKSISEAINNTDSFKKNGVRTLIVYPMNALVSDQLARFRRIMGSEKFIRIFTEDTHSERIPHFGMYNRFDIQRAAAKLFSRSHSCQRHNKFNRPSFHEFNQVNGCATRFCKYYTRCFVYRQSEKIGACRNKNYYILFWDDCFGCQHRYFFYEIY